MNPQEEIYFAALSKDRMESADILEKPSMRGAKSSVVDKYSDQAHFIYELLQNADDAHATSARFILEPDRLIFAHNGTRHFSVSDPLKEESDSVSGKLGDINAITSIANSNKTEASIGKFGVGFKAVFQYTSTPHIYDPCFRFRIDRFIVPILLQDDFPGRRQDETLFVFPFDHPRKSAAQAYEDIADKLRGLSFPLLFLTCLKSIEFEFGGFLGLYGKNIPKSHTYQDTGTVAEYVCLTQNDGDELYDENIWLFSRLDESNRKYSVSFFTDREGRLRPVRKPAFCFFPTKENTGLNFILHAPFLLTDNREGICAGEPHNDKMIVCLADLAADAMVYLKEIGEEESIRLIDDNIVTIIPVDPEEFSDPADRGQVSFLPFYQSIKHRFETAEILPAQDGYVGRDNAYWAAVPDLTNLFSNKQLSQISGNENAHWVFTAFGRDEVQRTNKALFDYVDALVKTNLNEDVIIKGRSKSFYYRDGVRQELVNIKGITTKFVESQPVKWLFRFYKWLSDTKHRTELSKSAPVFLDQNGKAVSAWDKDDHPILFLPVDGIIGITVIHPDLLKDTDTRKLIEMIGIKKPSLKDQIYNSILPQYRKDDTVDTETHFKHFKQLFKYYLECLNNEAEDDELEDYIELLKDYDILTYYVAGDSRPNRSTANSMYLPAPDLKVFFETKEDVRFVVLDEYKKLVGEKQVQFLLSFLTELGVRKEPAFIEIELNSQIAEMFNLPKPYSTQGWSWKETRIEGCREIIKHIMENRDAAKSVVLWNSLLNIMASRHYTGYSLSSLTGTCRYFYYSHKFTYFESTDAVLLKNCQWLLNTEGEFVSPGELTRQSLSERYDVSSEYSEDLLEFLNISSGDEESEEAEDVDGNLTEEQRAKIALANKMKEYGLEDESDLEEFIRWKKAREQRKGHPEVDTAEDDLNDVFGSESDSSTGAGNDTDAPPAGRGMPIRKPTADVVRDIVKRTRSIPVSVDDVADSEDDDDTDQDELMPSAIDYSKRIERAKQKSAAEIDKIAYFETLQNTALNSEKYSFAWFKALLELESIHSAEANSNSKEISIRFARVKRESGTERMLVLMHPNRYIPQFMEDLADIPLVLHMEGKSKTVAIEVANVRSYTLRVKLKTGADIDGIDLESVKEAAIDAKSPVFLLEELRKQFADLNFADQFNMQKNLCENIEFVFGPPGTGKTTHLAKNILIPLMKQERKCKVLVLTPTNQSADVLVRRIMEVSGSDHSFEDWLVRFGGTGDEEIEKSPVFKDKTFDIRTLPRNVTITTIARFPYDFFTPPGTRLFLREPKWDYIVIDEASMIPLANILYPLYKKTPEKFIVAGDPFQIEPITSVDLWKGENIYTMVRLNSFVNPQTIPHPYHVELLTTQYRSVPAIGSIFSSLAYGGILKHNRAASSQRPLCIGNGLELKTLNIIKFPVSRYESIYRAKRLRHSSSYQIYSALFTFEYVCFLSRAIAVHNPDSLFKIGIIAPYRAQADIIDKLMASENLPKEIDVQVGTIHGFQGDECDIVFAVFNPPPTISASNDMFLNKRNIINVAISRARDYLVLVMPDDHTENIENLRLVKRVEQLVKHTDAWKESLSPDLEELLLGDPKYLENNTFSTSHQNVNVYGLPEKCYEIRTEDNAVDVQIKKGLANPDAGQPTMQPILRGTPIIETGIGLNEDSSKEDLVPKQLRKASIEVQATGAHGGKYFLVPYKGKLNSFTRESVINMFIPQVRAGKEKLVSVSVAESSHIIYIEQETFKAYKKGLTDPAGFELRKGYFG